MFFLLPFFPLKLVPWYHLIGIYIYVYNELFGHKIIHCLAVSSVESELCLGEATGYNFPASLPLNSHTLAPLG